MNHAIQYGSEDVPVGDCDLGEACDDVGDFRVAISGIVRARTEEDISTASVQPIAHGPHRRHHPTIARIAILALLVLSAGMSRAGERGMHAFASLLLMTQLLPLCIFCRASGICFGRAGYLWKQSIWEFFVALASFIVSSLPWSFAWHIMPDHTSTTIFAVVSPVVPIVVASCFNCRWHYLFLAIACILHGCIIPFVWGFHTIPQYTPWAMVIMAIIFVLCIFMRYKKDQTSTAMLGVLIGYTDFSAVSIGEKPVSVIFTLLFSISILHGQILWMRRHRQLPPGLRGCKFVSLAYLRKVAQTSQGIRRCQDLPDEAFGDHTKAGYLIAVSHRWLDPYTCDVKTAQHPQGFRCKMMLEKLESFFSLRGIVEGWRSSPTWREFFHRLQMATTPGEDVLIFFDYMSLPQDTLSDDGTVLKRTYVERRQFLHCLPHMGALYSMFPVLVCEEVLEGLSKYPTSGWCFAEAATAWLSSQIRPYSETATVFHWFDALPRTTNTDIEFTAEFLARELEGKSFVRQRDRRAVEDIIRGFALKRRLVNAIVTRDFVELQRVLYSIDESSKGLLDQPVDRELNTPLHLAVAHNFAEGVEVLLECRAKPSLRNLHGDTPMQWYMFPRFSEAARVCKKKVQTRSRSKNSRDEEVASTVADESCEVSSRVHSGLHTPGASISPLAAAGKLNSVSWASPAPARGASHLDSSEDTFLPSADLSQPNEDFSSMAPLSSDPLKVSL